MSFKGPAEGEIRLALAEWIRQSSAYLDLEERKAVRVVTGYWDSTVTRYPGTSSTWEQYATTVGYETWDGDYKTFKIDGKFDKLLARLELLIEDYGND